MNQIQCTKCGNDYLIDITTHSDIDRKYICNKCGTQYSKPREFYTGSSDCDLLEGYIDEAY